MESLRQSSDKSLRIGGNEHPPELLLGGVGFGDQEILRSGAVEEETLLGNHRHGASQFGERDRPNRHAVEKDLSLGQFVEAAQQVDERRLARTGGADQCDHLARPGMEADVAKHSLASLVGEADALVAHLTSQGGREGSCRSAIPPSLLKGGVQNRKDPLAGCSAGLEKLVKRVETADRLIEERGEDQESDEAAKVHGSGKHLTPASQQDHHQSEIAQKTHRGTVKGPITHHHERGLAKPFACGVETGMLPLFGRIGFDLADPVEIVVKEGVEFRGGDPCRPIAYSSGQRIGQRPKGEKGHGC